MLFPNFFSDSSSLFDSASVQKLISQYAGTDNWHEIDAARNNLGYGFIHYSLIRTLKPRNVLCIGSRYGFIPAMCALACRDNQQGMVDFVDAGYSQTTGDENHWGGVGLWKTIDPDIYFMPFDLNQHITLHVQTSQQFFDIHNKHSWGYIHIDGDHSFKGAKLDYDLFWPKLVAGGFMCFHDIYTKELGGLDYGVGKLWDMLKLQHQTMEFSGQCGLGILRKYE
jgi:hypothetical protein